MITAAAPALRTRVPTGTMRSFLIVGAGPAGLLLAHGLLAAGHDVTIMCAKTPDEIRAGRITSTQATFGPALAVERRLGLDRWHTMAPPINGLHLALPAVGGPIDILGPLDEPGRSTDQRITLPDWLEQAGEHGATVIYTTVSRQDLDGITRRGDFDLVVIASGRGGLAELFPGDPARSSYDRPQRTLMATYVHGLEPEPAWPESHVSIHVIPGVGELVVVPALTAAGPCDAILVEAVPDGPADMRIAADAAPQAHLDLTRHLAERYVPTMAQRARRATLTDPGATLAGHVTTQVRRPVAQLPSGGIAWGLGDVLVTLDPISGQGGNLAARAAAHYLAAILERDDGPFDKTWMTSVFDQFWIETGQPVTAWTSALLQPPSTHLQQLFAAAASDPATARRLAAVFADPTQLDLLASPSAELVQP